MIIDDDSTIGMMPQALRDGLSLLNADGVEVVGRDIALVGSGGNRESMMQGGSGTWKNAVPANLDDWELGSNSTLTNNGDGSWRLQCPDDSQTYLMYTMSFPDDTDWTLAFDIRQTPSGAASSIVKVQSRDSDLVREYYSFAPPTDWTEVESTKDTNSAATDLYILDNGGFDIELRNVRFVNSTSAAPAFPAGSAAGYVMADTLDRYGLPAVGVSAAYTTKVPVPMTSWASFGITTPDAESIRETSATSTHLARYVTSTVSDTCIALEIEPVGKTRVQIDIDGNTKFVQFGLTGTGSVITSSAGASGSIDLMDDGYYRIVVQTIAASTNIEIRCVDDSGNTSYEGDITKGYNIRNTRASDSTAPMPPVPVGSPAGTVVAVDAPTCTPTWGSAGTILMAAMPYGWSDITTNETGLRLFENTNLIFYGVPSGNKFEAAGSGFTPTIDTGKGMSADTLYVVSADWDGVVIGARFSDTFTRTTATEADPPSGTLYIGNRADKARPFHGILITVHFPDEVISDAKYTALYRFFTAIAALIRTN